MDKYLKIEPFTFGMGDRFAHQAKAQLAACAKACQEGASVTRLEQVPSRTWHCWVTASFCTRSSRSRYC